MKSDWLNIMGLVDDQTGYKMIDQPIKDPPENGNGKPPDILIDEPPTKSESTSYYGTVSDSSSGEPVPGATVLFTSGDQRLKQVIADRDGYFEASFINRPDKINITAAEYKGWMFPASEYQHKFELEREMHVLDPVVVTAGKKSSWILAAIAAAVIYNESKPKRSVGKIDMPTLLVVGVGGAMLIGFDVVVKFLRELGIGQTKEGHDYDDQVSNPGSFWSPNFWKAGPPGTHLVTNDYASQLFNEIDNSFGFLGDDEAAIYAAFKKLSYQSQLSYFSYWVQQNKGLDLLKWLKGSDYGPWGDHLSVKEISVITDYFSRLPKFK